MFPKRRHSIGGGGIVMAGAALIGGIAIGITAHKFAPEIRSRVQNYVSHVDLNPFDDHHHQ
ncbi:MAG: hypothetical protein FWF88_04285 [Peptococcaceae bacterium]|jgi:hypothetical protein|nr:hypothetical protein [Peptococcaceae bacterium]